MLEGRLITFDFSGDSRLQPVEELQRPRVLFLIGCFGAGRGGHFYDLRTIVKAMSEVCDPIVVSVGTSASPVLRQLESYISFSATHPTFKDIRLLTRLVREKKVTAIHAFDLTAYLFARVVSLLTGTPVVLTKSGGPIPRRYFPIVGDLITYSADDHAHFSGRSRRHARVFYLPHRVDLVEPDQPAIAAMRSRWRAGVTPILRISRITEHHHESTMAAVRLVKRLRGTGLDVQLILIGVVQNAELLNEVLAVGGDDVVVITDDTYTIDASRLLMAGEIVVGTGRGVFEAALQKRLVLSQPAGMDIPILVTALNAEQFAASNFSVRSKVMIDAESAFEEIVEAIANSASRDEHIAGLHRFVRERYWVDSAVGPLLKVYNGASAARFRPLDMVVNLAIVWRVFVTARLAARREQS